MFNAVMIVQCLPKFVDLMKTKIPELSNQKQSSSLMMTNSVIAEKTCCITCWTIIVTKVIKTE